MPGRFDHQPPASRRGGLVRGGPSWRDRLAQRAAALEALQGRRQVVVVPEPPAPRVVPLAAQMERAQHALAGFQNAVAGIQNTWMSFGTTATTTFATQPITWHTTGGTISYSMTMGNVGTVQYQPQTQYVRTEFRDHIPLAPATPEQIAAHQARVDEYRRQDAERAAERERTYLERQRAIDAANARARTLMRAVVSDEQWAEFERDNAVTVRGSAGGLYRIICHGHDHNVTYLNENGEGAGELCAHPDSYTEEGDRLPETDLHVGQVLAIQADEQGWLARANGRRPPHYVPPPF